MRGFETIESGQFVFTYGVTRGILKPRQFGKSIRMSYRRRLLHPSFSMI